jgi:hypothetical protein
VSGRILVDYDGMRALAAAGDDQRAYLEGVRSFVRANCSDVGAFSGFMAIFRGSYSDALDSVGVGLDRGPLAADRVAGTVRANARTYRERDIAAATTLAGLQKEVRAVGIPSIGPAQPVGLPGVDGPIVDPGEKYTAGATGTVATVGNEGGRILNPHVPAHPWDDGPKGLNPLSPISLVGEVESGVATTQSGIEAGQDEQDYEEFEEGAHR